MGSVAIIGAGITGLTAAFRLQQQGIPVTVYEAGDRVGGVIRSVREDGFLAEFGPNSILETSPLITSLIRDAGLESRRIYSSAKAEKRYLVRYRRPISMAATPVGFFGSPLFSWRAKLRLIREPFLRRSDPQIEESVAQFVLRRLGQEFLDYAINPMVSGIYAGDPARLSVPHAFPKLHALEQRYGSLIRGQIFGARERKRRGEVSKQDAKKLSFDEGLQVLPDTLSQKLGEAIQLRRPVEAVTRVATSGYQLSVANGGTSAAPQHSAVVVTVPTYRFPEFRVPTLNELNPAQLRGMRYPPVASVVLGFLRADVAHPLDGFGVLIPKVEGFRILGTLFSSSLFPGRAPAGYVTLTSYVGGERAPELAQKSAEELVELTHADLRVLLGVSGEPKFRHVVHYPQAIPQYEVGFGRYRELMQRMEERSPGLFLAGHFRDGIALGDSILAGHRVAERVAAFCSADRSPRSP